MKKGRLIVIEGTDGSGKETQLKLLLDYFDKNKISYTSFDFPQYDKTFFGNFIGRFLNGEFGHLNRVNPYLAMFPYAGDRWQIKNQLRQAINEGKTVICNRYAPSISYQLAKVKPKERINFLRWAEKLEYQVFDIPKEDIVIFLHVPFLIAQKLIEKKKKRTYLKNRTKDQHEENVNYLQKVEKMYLWLNKTKKNWIKIDCVDSQGGLLSPDKIHNKILQSINI